MVINSKLKDWNKAVMACIKEGDTGGKAQVKIGGSLAKSNFKLQVHGACGCQAGC
jgi:hypothetical protein